MKPHIIIILFAFVLVLLLLSQNTGGPAISTLAQPTGWIELVGERTRTGKSFYDPSRPGIRAVDVSVAKVHYDGPNWKDIDNTLVPSLANVPTLGLVDMEMTTDDYEFYALQTLNTIPLWFYRNKSAPNIYITFNPQGIGWTNALDQIDPISMPQSVIGTVIGNHLHWEDAYGPGINLTLSAQAGRLAKVLTLETMPPAPAQYILDGGNPALELQFIFDTPSGPNAPEIWVDGMEWDQSARTETINTVEFKKNEETIFSFAKPSAFDSGFGVANPSFILTKQGPNLRVSIHVPLSFLESATYPVVIDPTVEVRIGTGNDDGYANIPGSGFNNDGIRTFIGQNAAIQFYGWALFVAIGVPQGAIIDSADIRVVADGSGTDGSGVKTNIYFEDVNNASQLASYADWADSVRTTAFTAWDDADLTVDIETTSPVITSVIQEITDRGGWASGANMQLLWDDDSSTDGFFYDIKTYDGSSGEAILLHIEYSVGWTNTAPTITNKISSEETTINTAYSRSFSATDPDTNQTLQWELNITNAPFTITVVNGQNRTTWVNATPDTIGAYYINVTVGDDAALGNETDFVNYTLIVADPLVPVPTTTIELALFFMVGFIPFLMAIGIGFWKEQAPLLMIGGIIGTLLGIWIMVAIYFVFGFMFVGIAILFLYIGLVNIEVPGGSF